MTRARAAVALAFVFAAGAVVGAFAARKVTVGDADYRGKEAQEAAADLLTAARALAENGSYENIAVGRVYYLTGQKPAGQEIFDRVLGGSKVEAGDVVRVARVYREAGEWEKARPLFERVLQMAPKDEDWAAEIGAHFLIAGERAQAEDLFARSFAQDPSNLRNTLRAAGAYLGLAPQP